MNRRRGIIWLIAGLVLAIVAAGLSFYAFNQAVTEQAATSEQLSTQSVVVARQAINERAVVRLADIGTEERPIEEVPSGAIFKTDDAVGRVSTRNVLPGQVILAQNLIETFPSGNLDITEISTGTVNFNEALGDDLVAYALPAADRLSSEGILLAGDRIDLLFSTDVVGSEAGTGGKVSIYAIQDLEILQIIFEPPPTTEEEGPADAALQTEALIPKTLILAIQPQDAVVLKYVLDTQSPIDLVLRGEENRRPFDVDAVHINTLSDRYRFTSPGPVQYTGP